MQLNVRFRFQVPNLGKRILSLMGEHGASASAARALGISRSRLSNLLNGSDRSCPLEHVLALERYLDTDLLGLDRQEIVAALRNLADRVAENRH